MKPLVDVYLDEPEDPFWLGETVMHQHVESIMDLILPGGAYPAVVLAVEARTP